MIRKRSKPRWRTAAIITVCLAYPALVFRMEHKRYGDPFLRLRIAVTSILWPAHVAASKADLNSKTNFISFSRVDKAQEISKGEGVKIAICDWPGLQCRVRHIPEINPWRDGLTLRPQVTV